MYYRMTYERVEDLDDTDVKQLVYAALANENERRAFEQADSEWVPIDGRQVELYSMTVDGVYFEWDEEGGGFRYLSERLRESIDAAEAEKMARDFLDCLEWELDDSLQVYERKDGCVEVECRFCYDGVKLLGNTGLYFESGNPDEPFTGGFYIKLELCGTGICYMSVYAPPRIKEILQEYNPEEDFLDKDRIQKVVRRHFAAVQDMFPGDETAEIGGQVSCEIIYMPYRDTSQENMEVLIPVFEVRVPTTRKTERTREYVVLYIDAVTGRIYDEKFEFY